MKAELFQNYTYIKISCEMHVIYHKACEHMSSQSVIGFSNNAHDLADTYVIIT